MNRREILVTAGSVLVPLSSGCSALKDDTGYTYTLTISGPLSEPTDRVLDYTTAGLTRSQEEIVEEAIRTDSYSEENVNWDTLPGRTGITMEFRMVIQLIARHVGHDPTVDHETSFETPSRYDERLSRSTVTVE
ncbi:hypothetical protein C477_01680 [Haloterrigena salina JCM 13891]|uniref:Uncharacterized protein n=1 Tax=Haloterrigena salina JCM 13891 TaxID=1227488 RepID=M0CMK5_9EURY|nr:hypothetical protein [Haloterrigena salina]ELZ23868.1 hypothetical protein C477_01680 [Haloterrigena salina JCM 13891]